MAALSANQTPDCEITAAGETIDGKCKPYPVVSTRKPHGRFKLCYTEFVRQMMSRSIYAQDCVVNAVETGSLAEKLGPRAGTTTYKLSRMRHLYQLFLMWNYLVKNKKILKRREMVAEIMEYLV